MRPASDATAMTAPGYSFAFQPIVDPARSAIVAYEALVRGQAQQPASWVLDHRRGDELLRFDIEARRRAIVLAEQLGLDGDLHLNLLPQGLEAFGPVALQSTIDMAQHCGIAPPRLVLEISESSVIHDLAAFVSRANQFKALGLRFAIDDFGAGYAGLSLLADFQPEFIKLDMKLVKDVSTKGPRQAIVRGILRTCEDLGIDVVAEGVEALDEFEWLRDEGVTLFQGFLFAHPAFEAVPGVRLPGA